MLRCLPLSIRMLSSFVHHRESCLFHRLQHGRGVYGRLNRLQVLAFRELDSRRASTSSSNGAGKARSRDFLEARQISLYELFDGQQYQLDVPEYQRPYAWRAKQVQELLSDLQAAYESGQEHFLGAIVTTRQGDSPGEPYWIIDGQQRLTTLVMLLGYLRAWAAAQPGMASLAERVEHMLHIPADPLNPAASARYRLLLRSSEQQFFIQNFIESYLPVRYHLSARLDGPANAAGDYHESTTHAVQQAWGSSSSSSRTPTVAVAAATAVAVGSHHQKQQQQPAHSVPLTNETWWRLYCAGDVLACYLASAIKGGLNLQDFMHHVLKNCMMVLMTARDESTSFKIFSTLNGRGVDLAVIDKLKPELLQALPVHLRQSYADRWSVMESALGRPSFHALFDHYITIEQASAAAKQPQPGSSSNNASRSQHVSWGHTPNEPGTSSTAPYIPAGSTLLSQDAAAQNSSSSSSSGGASAGGQHQSLSAARSSVSGTNSGSSSGYSRHDVLQQLTGHANVEGVLSMVLEYGQRLLQIRANDWSALEAEGGTAPAIAADLTEACFFINLLADDSWQPWALEFFYQSTDDAKRAAFLKGAELLSLYCELKQDEAFKRERWLVVGKQLLQLPFYSDQVLSALALSPGEVDDLLKLLDGRELAAAVDEWLLVHLLLRADCVNMKNTHWRRLKVEKVVPTHPPEGSQWRKQKLLLPALSESEQAAAGATGSSSQPGYAGLFQPARGRSSSGGSSSKSGGSRSSRGRTSSSMATASSAPSPTSSAAATVYGDETAEAAGSSSAVTGASSGSGSCNTVPSGMREVRYWHEITRSHWHNRLGNLVLLQPSGHESASSSHLSADLPIKLAHYAACSADEHFPEFTGGLVNGRYSRDMFCPEECRQRHGDIISRLIEVFGLHSGGL